jgi:hypothetical protein
MTTCQALIQQGERKGQLCGKDTDGKYCAKHKRYVIIDKAVAENIRYCDIARGCFTVLEDYQSKCTPCLHKARIDERKRNDKKRQDLNLCLDCGRAFDATEVLKATGKHDKQLRRCVPCYEKMKKIEAERPVRERNYKAEAFTNKHVIWNHYVKGAQKRNIHFTLSKTLFNQFILQKCFYCNYQKAGEVNGIDRVDNNKGYMEGNVVTCCETCNLAKSSQNPQEFVDKLHAIHLYITTNKVISEEIVEKWKSTYLSKKTANYKTYVRGANTRNIAFLLSEIQFSETVQKPCYLCGLAASATYSNGIDRFDNSKGYVEENCRPCCGHCNLLKKDIQYDDILRIAEQISKKYEELSEYFGVKAVPVRTSKIESRVRVENPLIQETIPLEYKLLNEIIIPKQEIPEEIKELLEEKKDKEKDKSSLKQWKSKQIYHAIQSDTESEYKHFCEANNNLSKIKT